MPPLNFTYAKNQPAGVAGALATTEHTEMVSRTNEDLTLIKFGVPVFRADGDRGATATIPADIDRGNFLGITTLDRGAYTNEMMTEEGFRNLDTMLVLRVGVIWVEVVGAVNAGEPVFLNNDGKFAASGVELPRAQYETSTSGAGLAQVRLVS